MNEPKVYIANLEAYNAGKLTGKWVEVTPDVQDLWDAVAEVCPEDQEWAIHDSEGLPKSLQSEHPDFDDLAKFVELSEEHDPELVIAAFDRFGDFAEVEAALTERFEGFFENMADFAYSLAKGCGDLREIPEYLLRHVDFDALGDEMESSGDYWTEITRKGLAVFRCE